MGMFKTLLLFILMLSLIIIIHEGGHLIAAKAFGVYCKEFSIGMGPKIFSKKFKETELTIRALPIGGFVAMAGDNDNELETKVEIENIPPERTLNGIAPFKRIIVMLAGIFMNLILALIIMAMLYLSIGNVAVSPKPIIADIKEGYPADLVGLKKGDEIIKISYNNGYSISPSSFGELNDFFYLYDGEGNIHLTVKRDNEKLKFDVKPVLENDEYIIGIYSNEYSIVETNIFNCWKYSASYLIEMTKLIYTTLIGLFRGTGLDNLSGPIGVYEATGEAISYGIESYICLIAMLSLNVGIFNALPLPIFDGGRVLLTLIEVITKKPINKEVENKIMTISTILVLALMLFVTFKDIFNLFGS